MEYFQTKTAFVKLQTQQKTARQKTLYHLRGFLLLEYIEVPISRWENIKNIPFFELYSFNMP